MKPLFFVFALAPSIVLAQPQLERSATIGGMEIRSTSLIFHGEEGNYISVVSWDHGLLRFEGDIDESAKEFFSFWHENYIKSIENICASVYPCESSEELKRKIKDIIDGSEP